MTASPRCTTAIPIAPIDSAIFFKKNLLSVRQQARLARLLDGLCFAPAALAQPVDHRASNSDSLAKGAHKQSRMRAVFEFLLQRFERGLVLLVGFLRFLSFSALVVVEIKGACIALHLLMADGAGMGQ